MKHDDPPKNPHSDGLRESLHPVERYTYVYSNFSEDAITSPTSESTERRNQKEHRGTYVYSNVPQVHSAKSVEPPSTDIKEAPVDSSSGVCMPATNKDIGEHTLTQSEQHSLPTTLASTQQALKRNVITGISLPGSQLPLTAPNITIYSPNEDAKNIWPSVEFEDSTAPITTQLIEEFTLEPSSCERRRSWSNYLPCGLRQCLKPFFQDQGKEPSEKYLREQSYCSTMYDLFPPPSVASFKLYGALTLNPFETEIWSQQDVIEEICEMYLETIRKKEHSARKIDQTLAVYKHGTGAEAIIMIHGICMSGAFWRDGLLKHIGKDFLKQYTFYCPDLLGYGKSKDILPCSDYSRKEQTMRIFKDVILKYQLHGYHLVGHSYGALVCLDVAAINPEATKSITLFAPAYFETQKCAYQILTAVPFPVSHTVSYPELGHSMIRILNRLRPWLAPIASKVIPGSEVPKISLWDFFGIDPDATYATLSSILFERVEPSLKVLNQCQNRIFIVHGEQDGVVPVKQTYVLASRYQNVSIQILPGMVHHFPVADSLLAAKIIEQSEDEDAYAPPRQRAMSYFKSGTVSMTNTFSSSLKK